MCLVLPVGLFLLAWNLIRSRVGRAMIAVRDQEIAACTVGVNVSWVKVATFALSAAYAGWPGPCRPVDHRRGANPIIYFQLSIEFLIAVVIGGAATIVGPPWAPCCSWPSASQTLRVTAASPRPCSAPR